MNNLYDELPNFVAGPTTLTEYYSQKYNKHIYVFGETHGMSEGECKEFTADINQVLPIHKFIEQLVRIQPQGQVIDVFLETYKRIIGLSSSIEYSSIDENDYDDLNNLRQYFRPYLTIGKRYDPLGFRDPDTGEPRVRFHYTDVRPSFVDYCKFRHDIYLESINENDENEFNYDIFKLLCVTTLILEDKLDELMNYMESNQIPDPLEIWYLEIVNSISPSVLKVIEDKLGLSKEIRKISDKNLRNWLKNHIKNSRENFIINLKEGLDRMLQLYHEPEFKEIFEELVSFIDSHLLKYITDYYLIARIFKAVRGGPSFDRVIIYAGNNHSEFYREILGDLGFTLINDTDNRPTKCIDIRSFKPFFNINLRSHKRQKIPSSFQFYDEIEDELFM